MITYKICVKDHIPLYSVSATLRETNRKFLVNEQKNHTLAAEIAAAEKSAAELKRRLEVKDGVITR